MITFTPGSFTTETSGEILGSGDFRVEGPEVIVVNVVSVSANLVGLITLPTTPQTLTILDNDGMYIYNVLSTQDPIIIAMHAL